MGVSPMPFPYPECMAETAMLRMRITYNVFMLRRLFTLLSAISLVLLLTISSFWAISHGYFSGLAFDPDPVFNHGQHLQLRFNKKAIILFYWRPDGVIPSIWIRYWMVLTPLALHAAWGALNVIERRRRPPGLCPSCNYDLRASTDRCPECGKPIPSTNPATTPTPAARSAP